MFTGLIEEVGTIAAIVPSGDGLRITVRAPLAAADAVHGASIAVGGVCLTVVESDATGFTADVMHETVAVSTVGERRPGDAVNVERATRLGDRLGGHIVQGHIDGTAEVIEVRPGERWRVLRCSLAQELAPLVTGRGSIAVDGVSLTVSAVGPDWFEVSLIPETLVATTLGDLAPGDRVNVETDILARHVARLQAFGLGVAAGGEGVALRAETDLPTDFGTFRVRAYREERTGFDHLAIIRDPIGATPLVRLHSECLTGESLRSLKCECGPQLDAALERVAEEGGIVLYLRGHEGRGIGLVDKLRAYRLQQDGLDTVDANRALGLAVDLREYAGAAAILAELGATRVRLITNNPDKVRQLEEHGIEVVETVPSLVGITPENLAYLGVKRDRMGHLLPDDLRAG